MGLRILNPYDGAGRRWLRGNLHVHTTQSDGSHRPQETVDAFAAHGYDFLMLSDHDRLTDPAQFDDRGMMLIPGNDHAAHRY